MQGSANIVVEQAFGIASAVDAVYNEVLKSVFSDVINGEPANM